MVVNDIEILVKTLSLMNLTVLLKIMKKKRKLLRRWWVKPHITLQQRNQYGAYGTLFKYFCINDHEEFYTFVRMDFNHFLHLYNILEVRLRKTSRRPSLPPMLRLASVLCDLAHGGSTSSVAWLFRISKEIMYRMIVEVSSNISDVLMPVYVEFPNNKQRWLEIINDYWMKWQFPNCIGALDGKHFEIICPPKSGSIFNCKKFFSIVMLALCDANYKFIWFNVGDYGSCSDSSIFGYTDLYSKIINNTLGIPESHPLPNSDVNLPVAIVADAIFALNNQLLKPYNRRLDLSYEKKKFNYRLSRARLTIECAFGILTSRYSILRQPLKFDLCTCKSIAAACVCLHNYNLIKKSPPRENNENLNNERAPEVRIEPIAQRDLLAQYFTAPVGAVP